MSAIKAVFGIAAVAAAVVAGGYAAGYGLNKLTARRNRAKRDDLLSQLKNAARHRDRIRFFR